MAYRPQSDVGQARTEHRVIPASPRESAGVNVSTNSG